MGHRWVKHKRFPLRHLEVPDDEGGRVLVRMPSVPLVHQIILPNVYGLPVCRRTRRNVDLSHIDLSIF